MSRACSHLTRSVLGLISAERRNTVLLVYGALHRRGEAIALLELLLRSLLCGTGLVLYFSLGLGKLPIGLSHAFDVQLEGDRIAAREHADAGCGISRARAQGVLTLERA